MPYQLFGQPLWNSGRTLIVDDLVLLGKLDLTFRQLFLFNNELMLAVEP